MQQIYRRTPMPKCDFNKVAKHLWTATSGYENMSCEHAQCQELQQNKTIQHNTQGFSYFQSSVVQKFALSQFRNYLPLKNGIKCTHKYNIPISITLPAFSQTGSMVSFKVYKVSYWKVSSWHSQDVCENVIVSLRTESCLTQFMIKVFFM